MALKSCLECGHQISTKAVSCPSCGHPNTEQTIPKVPKTSQPIYRSDPKRGEIDQREGMGRASPFTDRTYGSRTPEEWLRMNFELLESSLCKDLNHPDLTRKERAQLKRILKMTRTSIEALQNGRLESEEGSKLISDLRSVWSEATKRIR
tara:strand:- start:111 stop:560 length:450 start_codon:yes stop_codon:yes gene_type:complete